MNMHGERQFGGNNDANALHCLGGFAWILGIIGTIICPISLAKNPDMDTNSRNQLIGGTVVCSLMFLVTCGLCMQRVICKEIESPLLGFSLFNFHSRNDYQQINGLSQEVRP